MLIAENRKALVPICLEEKDLDSFDSPALYAAKELRWYLGRITSAVFEIKACTGERCIRIRTDDLEKNEDRVRVEAGESGILLTGGRRGTVYAVYEFLERLGCRFFTCICEKIPVQTELDVPEMHVDSSPRFEYREHNYADVTQNVRFAVKCRLNGAHHKIPDRMGGHLPYAWFVHSFDKMLPADVYGPTHPEYFSLVDGKRVTTGGGRTQLCLTNPDVLEIAVESVRRELTAHPEARIISISQNDWLGNCQCEACRRADEEEGSPSGTLLRFVNAIAERLEGEFPRVLFDTLAYQYTRRAPRVTRNRHNVCVRICSIECCFSHPMGSCDHESGHPDGPDAPRFIDDLRAWGKISDRMYIWDYTTCFSHYPAPYANWRVLQPNLLTMAENHVKGVFEQACGASRGSTDFNELRLYLLSKLMWDPEADVAALRREFMEYVYGDAAPALMRYLDLLCDEAEKANVHIHYNDNLDAWAYLDESCLERYDRLFDEAAEAVKGDALRLMRVEKARLSLRWVRLKRKAMLKNEIDAAELEAFTSDWRAFGMSRIDEWYNLESTHRAFLDGLWRARSYFSHWTGEEPEVF